MSKEDLFQQLLIGTYISVELSRSARKVARVANECTPGFRQGLAGKHDIFDITEQMIKDIEELGFVNASAMCNDVS